MPLAEHVAETLDIGPGTRVFEVDCGRGEFLLAFHANGYIVGGIDTDPGKIKAPFQGHFANQDDWCTPEVVNDFEKKMASGGNKPEVFRYDAQHAFANEKSPAYDAPSAKASWERMMAFLGKHL